MCDQLNGDCQESRPVRRIRSAGIDAITEWTCIILVRKRPVLVALATELTSRRSFAKALGIGRASVYRALEN